jgi:NADH dehydrogenase FAD-containing subunit
MKKTEVIIAGGGFAGLSAAMYLDKTLARREDVEVTLISRENFILFTPMSSPATRASSTSWIRCSINTLSG